MKFTFCSTTFVVLMCYSIYAQESSPPTLPHLWQKVENNYQGILAENDLIDAISHEKKVVKSKILPQIKLQAQNTFGTFKGSNGAFFPQAGFFNVSGNAMLEGSNQTFNTFASAVAEWEFYNFGKQNQDLKAISSKQQQYIANKEIYLLELKKELTTRYVNSIYAAVNHEWIARNATRLQNINSLTASLTLSGIKPAADSLLTYSALLQTLSKQNAWEGQQQAALISLAELTNESMLPSENHLSKFLAPTIHFTTNNEMINNHPMIEKIYTRSKLPHS